MRVYVLVPPVLAFEPDNLAPCPTPGADCHVSSMPKAPVVNTTDALGLVF